MGLKSTSFRAALAASAACAAAASAGGAHAQEVMSSIYEQANAAAQAETNTFDSASYNRGRNESVLERPRPDYQAVGARVGSVMIYPKISLGVSYDDNVLATGSAPRSDAIFSVQPELTLQTDWPRDSVTARVWVDQEWYARDAAETSTGFGGSVIGKVEAGQSTLTAGVQSGQYILPRWISNNTGATQHRINYDLTDVNGEVAHEFVRLRLSAKLDYELYGFENGVSPAGGTVLFKDQNHQEITYSGKAEFALTPDAAIYVTGSGNNRWYDLMPPAVFLDRNSNGWEVDAGANFDVTRLVRGEIQIGYLSQSFDSPLLRPIDGLSALGKLEWFPTQLTTVTIQGARTVAASDIPGSAGYLSSNVHLEVDHELLRNLILGLNGWYGEDQYNGITRNDDRDGIGATATWLLNRRVGLTFAYGYVDQRSHGVDRGPSFTDNRATLSAVLQF